MKFIALLISLLFMIVQITFAASFKDNAYFSIGADAGYMTTTEDRSDTKAKSGYHLDGKLLLSYHLPKALLEIGGGWFYNQISNSKYTITTTSGFLEANALYKNSSRVMTGLTSQVLMGVDSSFSEYSYPSSAEPFLGVMASYTPKAYSGLKKMRFDFRVMRSLMAEDRAVYLTGLGITFSFPFDSSPTRKVIVEKKQIITNKVQFEKIGKHSLRSTFNSETGMYFKSGSAEANQKMYRYLLRLAHFLKKFSKEWKRISVHGHTDDVGDYQYNKNLSLQRANTVKNILVQEGVSANRIKIYGHGPDYPQVRAKTKEARSKNRRVEIRYRGLRDQEGFMNSLAIIE